MIVHRILCGVSADRNRTPIISSANVAGFCMSIVPQADNDISGKVLHLISTCTAVAHEFHHYRAALHPGTNQKIWQGEGNRSDAVRDFTIFAVNCLHRLLGKNETSTWNSNFVGNAKEICPSPLSQSDLKILERTADLWQRALR
jgi:hypothetical protein